MAPEAGKNSRKAPRILIVDDDASQRSLLDSFLTSQKFETVPVASGEKALEVLRTGEISMMISDVRMPGISGLETLRRARQAHALLPILLVTAYTDIREAVGAMRDGAVNYLGKPIDLDELLASVRQATGLSAAAPLKFNEDKQLPGHVIARSPLMQAVFGDVSLIAPSESRVLITGESGVGKEVVVDVMHAWSARASGPLVKVNCAAIPETLLESELFGHERGAFTGAAAQRIGRFEEEEVKQGGFREDLFYRLNVVELNVPPLRERREDILPLASQFMTEFTHGPARFSSAVAECLERYPWPGNVRELRNAMERASLLSRGEVLLPEHLSSRVRQVAAEAKAIEPAEAQRLEVIEREAIIQMLRKHDFNRTETAKALGISRRAMIYKLQRLRELGHQVDPR